MNECSIRSSVIRQEKCWFTAVRGLHPAVSERPHEKLTRLITKKLHQCAWNLQLSVGR